MKSLEIYAKRKLETLNKLNLERFLTPSEDRKDTYIIRNGRRCINFSCNDYLGLSQNKEVLSAAQKALLRYGSGGRSSRYVTGDTILLKSLEQKIAQFKQEEDCIVFGSGYLTNIGVIPALMRKNDLILMDSLSHACMIDGAKLSGAETVFFNHNHIGHLKRILEKRRKNFRHVLILTETVFSMDGDRAPLDVIASISQQHDAWVLIDDAHGFGVLGEGRGGLHAFTPKPYIPLKMGTLSKAIGAYGGYLCASKELCHFLRNKCRTAIYSTALPPAVIASAHAAITVIENHSALTHKPVQLAQYFCERMNLPVTESPIVPLILGTEEKVLKAQSLLEREGFLGIAIRPPTVPKGTSRLRFTFSALHKQEDIEKLASTLLHKVLNKVG